MLACCPQRGQGLPPDPQTLTGRRGGQSPGGEGSPLGPGTSLPTEGHGVGFAGTRRASPDPPGPVFPRKPESALNRPCRRLRSGDGRGRAGAGTSSDLTSRPLPPPREHLFWSVCLWRAPGPRHHGVQSGGPLRRGAVPRRERRSGAPGAREWWPSPAPLPGTRTQWDGWAQGPALTRGWCPSRSGAPAPA